VTYIASAPKSNASAMAIWSARKDVQEGRTLQVPKALRDAHYRGAKRLGHGEDYQYSHYAPSGYLPQDYLPEAKQYYIPVDRGHEAVIKRWLEQLKQPSADPESSEPKLDDAKP
jgi:putative ATPase